MDTLTFDDLLSLGSQLGKGKTSTDSVSLAQSIKEAQETADASRDRSSSTPAPKTREQRVAEAVAMKKAGDRERDTNLAKFGTADPSQVKAVEGQGPFDPNFDFLAKTNPEKAQAAIDNVRSTLGIAAPTQGRQKPERIWQGTQTTEDGREIPYFTNLPPGDRMEGVTDLHRYHAAEPATAGLGGGDTAARRAVARKLDAAQEQVTNGPKDDDVVAKEAAQHLPEFLGDIKKFGKDEAANRQFQKVAAGKLSDAAYKRMHAEAAPEAMQQDAQEYATTRNLYAEKARANGAQETLKEIDDAIANGEGNPKHLMAVQREITARARPYASTELLTMPDLYFPYSAADAENVRKRGQGAEPQAAADATAEEARATLSQTVQGQAGTPARTMNSYIGQTENTPTSQSTRVGSADLGYEMNAPFIPDTMRNATPSYEDAMSWLEGGGDIARGHAARVRRGKVTE